MGKTIRYRRYIIHNVGWWCEIYKGDKLIVHANKEDAKGLIDEWIMSKRIESAKRLGSKAVEGIGNAIKMTFRRWK